jgi:hypothetical protein
MTKLADVDKVARDVLAVLALSGADVVTHGELHREVRAAGVVNEKQRPVDGPPSR